jgi:hypothetical protein
MLVVQGTVTGLASFVAKVANVQNIVLLSVRKLTGKVTNELVAGSGNKARTIVLNLLLLFLKIFGLVNKCESIKQWILLFVSRS